MAKSLRKNNQAEKSQPSDRLEHEQILAQGKARFPEESYQQLLLAGASSEEALEMLGYSADRKPLVQR